MVDQIIPSAGKILRGTLFDEPMRVETAEQGGNNTWMLGLVGMQSERFRRVTLSENDLAGLIVTTPGFTYTGDGRLLRLGLQAYALSLIHI